MARNFVVLLFFCTLLVALRKESVDRNKFTPANMGGNGQSLSARRAWIEIEGCTAVAVRKIAVALRKESVDRNFIFAGIQRDFCVALRKESVDRNDFDAPCRPA